jgi:hypothetical protein
MDRYDASALGMHGVMISISVATDLGRGEVFPRLMVRGTRENPEQGPLLVLYEVSVFVARRLDARRETTMAV